MTQGEYGVRYFAIDRHDRRVIKTRFFATATAREKWISKNMHTHIVEILGYTDPKPVSEDGDEEPSDDKLDAALAIDDDINDYLVRSGQ